MRSLFLLVAAMAAVSAQAIAQSAAAPVVGRILKIRPPVSIRLAGDSSWKTLTSADAKNLPLHVDDSVKCGRGGYVLLYIHNQYVEPNPCTSEYAIPYTSTQSPDNEHFKIGGDVGFQGLDFRIHNDSALAVTRLFVRQEDVWGPADDVLQGSEIASGSEMIVRFHGSSENCNFDVTAVLSDGSTEKKLVNLCTTAELNVGR
jgi:hypothetical protein